MMAAFSRGLGLALNQRIFSFAPTTAGKSCSERPMARVAHAIHRSPIIQAARNLQTSARLQASKKAPVAKLSKRASAPAQSNIGTPDLAPPSPKQVIGSIGAARKPTVGAVLAAPTRTTVARKLADRGRPTVLYETASNFWLRASSISGALFCFAYTGVNYYTNVLHPPPGLSWYVPTFYAFICLFTGFLGYLFLISTSRVVRRITAVPISSLPATYLNPSLSKMAPADKAALRALQASPVALECEVGGLLPLLGDRKLVAAPSEVFAPFKWVRAPVSQGFKGAGGVMAAVRRGLVAEGFSPIMVKGGRYKIDVLNGHVFDHGKAVDQLLPSQPDQFSNTWVDRLFKR